MDVVTKLRYCNKTLWAKAFPVDDHGSYEDGLEAAVMWLQASPSLLG